MRSRMASVLATIMVTAVVVGPLGAPPPPPPIWFPPQLLRAEFSRDGKLVLAEFFQQNNGVGTFQPPPCLYDAATGKKLAEVPSFFSQATMAAIHPDGEHILLAKPMSQDRYVGERLVLWNWKTGKEVRTFAPTTAHLFNVAISPDGKFAFTGHWDNRILVWDIATGKQIRAFDSPQKKDLSTAHVFNFFQPGDGKRAVTGYMDSIKVWDVDTGKPIGPEFAEYDKAQRISRHTPCCCCSADGRYACTALGLWEAKRQPRLRIWDLNSGKLFQEINVGADGYISGAAFAEKGRVLLAVDNAEWLHVFEVATGKSVESMRLRKQPKRHGLARLGDAAFSPDGRLLLTQGDGTTVQMWDMATRKPIWSDSVKGKN